MSEPTFGFSLTHYFLCDFPFPNLGALSVQSLLKLDGTRQKVMGELDTNSKVPKNTPFCLIPRLSNTMT